MIKKRGRGGIGAAHRQSQENMIKEEELSDEEDDEEAVNSSPYNRKTTLEAKKSANNQYENLDYPEGSRPQGRMGNSRAFHQTQDNWKDPATNVKRGAQSLPRNPPDSGQYSCKATSSATSLTVINKHPASGQQNANQSVSPKPYTKWQPPAQNTTQQKI